MISKFWKFLFTMHHRLWHGKWWRWSTKNEFHTVLLYLSIWSWKDMRITFGVDWCWTKYGRRISLGLGLIQFQYECWIKSTLDELGDRG